MSITAQIPSKVDIEEALVHVASERDCEGCWSVEHEWRARGSLRGRVSIYRYNIANRAENIREERSKVEVRKLAGGI